MYSYSEIRCIGFIFLTVYYRSFCRITYNNIAFILTTYSFSDILGILESSKVNFLSVYRINTRSITFITNFQFIPSIVPYPPFRFVCELFGFESY